MVSRTRGGFGGGFRLTRSKLLIIGTSSRSWRRRLLTSVLRGRSTRWSSSARMPQKRMSAEPTRIKRAYARAGFMCVEHVRAELLAQFSVGI